MTRTTGLMVVALLASCGLTSDNNRCDLRPKSDQCTDWRNTNAGYAVTQQAVCKTLAVTGEGVYTSGAKCDITNMWGGCQVDTGVGGLQTNWYYKGTSYKTIDDAKKECDGGMKWVDPQ